jgi:hypothetical protein
MDAKLKESESTHLIFQENFAGRKATSYGDIEG